MGKKHQSSLQPSRLIKPLLAPLRWRSGFACRASVSHPARRAAGGGEWLWFALVGLRVPRLAFEPVFKQEKQPEGPGRVGGEGVNGGGGRFPPPPAPASLSPGAEQEVQSPPEPLQLRVSSG